MDRPAHRSHAWRVCGVASAVVAIVCVSGVSGIRTFSHALDYGCVLAAVAAYAVVAIAVASMLRPRAAALAAGAVVSAPLLALVAFIASFGSGLFVGIGLIVAEMTAPPEHTEELSATLSCRVYGWGMAFSDEGYTVYVYRHPPFVRLVQREVAHVTVDETSPGTGPRSASCASVAAPLR